MGFVIVVLAYIYEARTRGQLKKKGGGGVHSQHTRHTLPCNSDYIMMHVCENNKGYEIICFQRQREKEAERTQR